MFYLTSFIVT